MADLTGKVAIVVGCATGIGPSCARVLAERGAAVVLADIQGDTVAAHADALRGMGFRAASVRTDIADEDAVRAMVGAAVDAFGGVDILHNNAAALSAEVRAADHSITEFDPEIFVAILRTNVVGYALTAKHAIPRMLERGGGVVINTSSAGGHSAESHPMYGTSKAALFGLTRSIATLYGKRGIRCVSISPGRIVTPELLQNETPEGLERRKIHNLVDYNGTPDDVAHAVAYLASDEASFVTGVDLQVDGGLLSHFPGFADDLRGIS